MKNNLRRLSASTTLSALLILGMVSHVDTADAAAPKHPKRGRVASLYAENPVKMGVFTAFVIAAAGAAGTGVYFLGKEVKERYIDKKTPEQTVASPVNSSNNPPNTKTPNQSKANNDAQTAESTEEPQKPSLEATIEETTPTAENPASSTETQATPAETPATSGETPETPEASTATEDDAQPQGIVARAKNAISELNPLKFSRLNRELSKQERQIAEKAAQNRLTKKAQDEAMEKLHAELDDIDRRTDDLNHQASRLDAKESRIQRKDRAISSFMTHEENKQTRSATISALEAKKTANTITNEEKLKLDELKLHEVLESRASSYEAVLKN